jgi:TolB-like protein/Tfp pilus assembly protein PilF
VKYSFSLSGAPMEDFFAFGRFRFERKTGRLWSGLEEVRLTPKAAGVLAALVSRAGEPVTREELFASLWRDVVVTDDALTSCIQELRKALGDDAKRPRFIETRHRRGYRFIAPLSSTNVAESSAGQAPTLLGSSARTGRPTVLVLPFKNVSGDAGQEYFSEGVTEDIITAMAKHRSILVISRGSAFAFKGSAIDARRAGIDLGANYVVEGSVMRSGQLLRVTARLIETEGGRHVWAERYDRDVQSVLEVRDEITTAIAGRIEPEVGNVERRLRERKSPQTFEAWDFFHLGLKHIYQPTVEDNQEAQRLLRRAIELDPALAEAYAWLSYAVVLSMVYFDVDPDDERLTEALNLAQKGIELDDQDALIHFAYGRALLARKAYEDALAELETAADLNPSLAVAFCGLGDSLACEGRIDEAIPYFEKAINLSPFDPQRWAFYAYGALAHLFAGQFESALEWSQKAVRVPHCHYWPFVHRVSALGHLQQAEPLERARAELLQRKPAISCAVARQRLFWVKNAAHVELYVDGLRKAGIRE